MSVVLGFSNTHNGGVALICDGEVRVAIQAERLSRIKRKSLPLNQEKELASNQLLLGGGRVETRGCTVNWAMHSMER